MQKHLFCLLFLFCCIHIVPGQIILTEIMFDLEGSDYHDEFIEIHNTSADSTVDLNGWQINDSLSSDQLTDAGYGTLLAPGRYAVILDGSYFGNSTTYDKVIPDSALIIKIDDKAFGSYGLSNSENRLISLIDTDLDTVQQYRYTVDNQPGYSDEKILLTADNGPGNWRNSIIKGGTPGIRNSVAPFDFDIGFGEGDLTYHPQIMIKTGQRVIFDLTISNLGLNDFRGRVKFVLFIDANNDSLHNAGDALIDSSSLNLDLSPDQNKACTAEWIPRVAGKYTVAARIDAAGDQNPVNNFINTPLNVVESRETVRINEIKFLAAENEPEWLELINTGDEPLLLKDWGIADTRDTCWIDTMLILHPGQYKIIAADSGLSDLYSIAESLICIIPTLPNLNNSGDVVYLLNPVGGWIEQVPYSIDWLEGEDWRNPSLERINFKLGAKLSRNWGPSTAAAGATPTAENAIFTSLAESDLQITISPNPFSPDNDGFEDHALINIQSPATAARMRIEIFDILGRRIRTLEDNTFSGSRSAVVWDGKCNDGRKAKMGIYIVYVQVLDDRNGLIKEIRETVVLAGKL